MSSSDYNRAAGDPTAAFGDPDEILAHQGFSREQKRELLRRWRERLGQAAGDSTSMLGRIGRALEFLDTETGTQPQTHEQVLHGPGTAPEPSGRQREEKA